MKKLLAIILTLATAFTACSAQEIDENLQDENQSVTVTETETVTENDISIDSSYARSREYIEDLGFTGLDDENLMRYMEDIIYSDLVDELTDDYYVENIETVYISKEYLDEVAYNSQENIYFGYTLSELNELFQGQKYIFTLSESGQTEAVPFEEYDGTFDEVVRNVAIGTGVILVCVTVSVIAAPAAPAISVIFAASAKSATIFGLSSGVISGVSAGIVEGIETGDFDKALNAAALSGSEGFMYGAISGAISGGAETAIALKGATAAGLTMDEVATIQKETKWPISVIKQIHNMDEYQALATCELIPVMVDGETALRPSLSSLDPDLVDDMGRTNLQRAAEGLAMLDKNGNTLELHHIGQQADATLALLTQEQHDAAALHGFETTSLIDRTEFAAKRKAFWKSIAQMAGDGITW